VTFTFSEDPLTSFPTDDITVTGGTIASLAKTTGDTTGKVWTAEFTPTSTTTVTTGSILVKDGSYTDAAGNTGAASTSLALKVNTTNPTVAVTSSASTLKAGETSVLTFTFSDAVTGFEKADVKVTGGTISDPVKSTTDSKVYTATFTPTASVKVAAVEVLADSYTDASGAKGLVGGLSGGLKVNQTVPTLTTIALDSATTDGNLVYKVTGSEAFDLVSSVSPTITNGAIVSTPTASSDRTTYLMTVKPTASGDVGVSIPVGAVTNGTFTNAAAVASTAVKVVLGTSGNDTLTSAAGTDFVFPGAGNDTLQLSNTNQSTVALPDTIAGIAIGDVLDVSGLLKTGAGYTSQKVADAVDTGEGFVELKNLQLTQLASTTRVNFDISFDAATLNNSKIEGAVFNLAYDFTKIKSISASQPGQFQYTDPDLGVISVDPWSLIGAAGTLNPQTGIIPVIGQVQNNAYLAANPVVFGTTNKVLSVTLVFNGVLDSVPITLSSAVLNTSLAKDISSTVGISKTARLAGASSSTVVANTLEVVKDTGTLGTVTDNQFRYLETVNADGKTGTIQFRYDTNSAAGTTTASDIVAVNLISADNLATFFAADHYKVI
jgi:hypothetical protein